MVEAWERMMASNLAKKSKKLTTYTLLLWSNPTCCYCQQSHSPANCTVVMKIDARRQTLLELATVLDVPGRAILVKNVNQPANVPDVVVSVHLVSILLATSSAWLLEAS